MNNRFLHQYDVDLLKPRTRKALQSLLMSQDEMSDVFVISVYEGGAAVALEGTATAFVQRGDGNTVEETGTISGNTITIPLSEHSYYIPGVVIITVKLITSNATNSLIEINGTVRKSSTGNIIDPTGETIIRVEEVFERLEEADEILDAVSDATDAANAAAENALGNIAPAFAQGTANAAGTYVTYTDGKLYFLPSGHTANATWANTTKTEVTTGGELSDLKSAITITKDSHMVWERGSITTNNGTDTNASNRCRSVGYISFLFDGTVAMTVKSGIKISYREYINTSGGFVSDTYTWYDANFTLNVDSSHFYRFVIAKTDDSDVWADDFSDEDFSFTQYVVTDDTLTMSGKAADAKKTGDSIVELSIDVNDVAEEFDAIAGIPGSFYSYHDKCNLKDCANLNKVFITNKNIIPVIGTTSTNNDVTKTVNLDGSISLSGTSTGTATFSVSAGDMPPIKDGNFVMSLKNSLTCGDDDTYLQLQINSDYSVNYICRFKEQNASIAFKLSDSEVVTGYRIRVSSGVTFPEGFKIYPQIEEGTAETAFVKNETKSFTPTAASTDDVDCFVGYNYIASNMTGNVEYTMSLEHELGKYANYTSKLKGKTIVCFGDSITGNYPAPNDYPSMLAEATGATVYNAGFGGCCMADNHLVDASQTRYLFTMCRLADAIAAGDFSAQANSGVSITYKQGGANVNYVPARVDMLSAIDWSKVDFITIAYGSNDWNSNYGLDNENDPDDTTTYIGAFRYSVEKILTAYPNIKILPITPLWRYWDSDTGLPSGQTGDYLDANTYAKGTGYYLWNYGDALIEAAKEYHIPALDMYHNCMINKFNRHQYFNVTDGTHPKYEGRKLFAEILAGTLESKY